MILSLTTPDWVHRSISIAIISRGRPEVLEDTLESIFRQSQQPQQVIVVVPTEEDLPRTSWGESVQFIVGLHGGCVQRNKALEAIPLSIDYVCFFDDDIELRVDFLEQATLFMRRNPTTIAFSGELLADGNGVTREEAKRLLANHTHGKNLNGLFRCKGKFTPCMGATWSFAAPFSSTKGSMRTFRSTLSRRITIFRCDWNAMGILANLPFASGSHLASPGGRVREVLRGYSFVANPWYFLKKGTVHLPPFLAWVRFWLAIFGKTFLFTLWKVLSRDRSLDWAGRLKGILLAFQDIILGRSHPRRILDL